MRISDWSSDVCSSDLVAAGGVMDGRGIAAALAPGAAGVQMGTAFLGCPESGASETHKTMPGQAIGRASCRARGCQYVYISEFAVSLKRQSDSDVAAYLYR